jgi:bifunctional DNA-binding transcriptional regulator/antitoxin component of YhaV-PrlF toxin-antitoxin module
MTKPESFLAVIISDGRITIPLPTRELLGLKQAMMVRVKIEKVET